MEECECRTEFSATHPVPKNVEFPLHRLQILDFGSVKFGKKSTKLFDILNTSNVLNAVPINTIFTYQLYFVENYSIRD